MTDDSDDWDPDLDADAVARADSAADPLAGPGGDGDGDGDDSGRSVPDVDWRAWAKRAATVVVLAVLLGGWVLAAQAFGWLAVGIVTGALVGGVVLLPAVWYLFGKELPRGFRTVAARILWTIGALIFGPYVLDWTERGRVAIRPADPEHDRMQVDGEWEAFDPDGNWSRLGKSQFGISWEKSDDALRGTAVEPDGDKAADGGAVQLGMRGGERIASRIVSTGQNLVVDVSRVVNRYRGAAGGAVADAAKMDGLRDHGGGGSIGAKWLIIGILGSLLLGAISGWVMFAA
jgi:hypothetical protein